jgi:hypothetical protein
VEAAGEREVRAAGERGWGQQGREGMGAAGERGWEQQGREGWGQQGKWEEGAPFHSRQHCTHSALQGLRMVNKGSPEVEGKGSCEK